MFGRAPVVVLGVDPGLTRCGYAVLRMHSAQQIEAVAMGVVRTPVEAALADRLAELHREFLALLDEFSPDVVAIEQIFFQNNVRTAMSVGQASGVVLSLSAVHGCDVAQYTPSQVKNTVAGWGNADKSSVARMVQQRLGLSKPPTPADAADAAAIALCHCAIAPMQMRTQASLEMRA